MLRSAVRSALEAGRWNTLAEIDSLGSIVILRVKRFPNLETAGYGMLGSDLHYHTPRASLQVEYGHS
jgi:hypothetical protein